ncbi:MAG: hypothetical protein GY800_04075 [Planctomycetes bacterium]|nr:hypothetical protein [Planctomycetota bacterium]
MKNRHRNVLFAGRGNRPEIDERGKSVKKLPLHPAIVLAPMAVAFFAGGITGAADIPFFPTVFIYSFFAGAGWLALQTIFLYRLWALAQASDLDIKKPSPGKAIGFWYIPFYGLYWTFIVWMNLAKHMNHMTKGSKRVPVTLVIIGCGLFDAGIFFSASQGPYVYVLAGIFVDFLSVAGIVILLICNFYFYEVAADICGPPGASAS